MKFVRVAMPDGSRYDVPLQVLAERLAKKQAEDLADRVCVASRLTPGWKEAYAEQYVGQLSYYEAEAMKTDITDFLAEAAVLDWERDVAAFAIRTKKPEKVDLGLGWTVGLKEVIEK